MIELHRKWAGENLLALTHEGNDAVFANRLRNFYVMVLMPLRKLSAIIRTEYKSDKEMEDVALPVLELMLDKTGIIYHMILGEDISLDGITEGNIMDRCINADEIYSNLIQTIKETK